MTKLASNLYWIRLLYFASENSLLAQATEMQKRMELYERLLNK